MPPLASAIIPQNSHSDWLRIWGAGHTFEELLRLLTSAAGARIRLVHTPPSLGFAMTRLVGLLLRDTVLTRDEVDGLMAGLLTSNAVSTATTRLGRWLEANAQQLGRHYVSELSVTLVRDFPTVMQGEVLASLLLGPHIILASRPARESRYPNSEKQSDASSCGYERNA